MPQLWVTPEELTDVSSYSLALEACQVATNLLWSMSGRRHSGVVMVTEHYQCPKYATSTVEPVLLNGDVVNRRVRSQAVHGDVIIDYVRLRHRPVIAIQSVISRGATLAPTDYTLYNRSVLQSSIIDPCDVTVTYTYDSSPPRIARVAARDLAQEFLRSWTNTDCALPERVTSISRQGISYTVIDEQTLINDLRTGVYSVDLFLKAANANRAQKRARIFSPDVPRALHVTPHPAVTQRGDWDFVVIPGSGVSLSFVITDAAAAVLANTADWETAAVIRSYAGVEIGTISTTLSGQTLGLTVSEATVNAIAAEGGAVWELRAVSTAATGFDIYLLSGNISIGA